MMGITIANMRKGVLLHKLIFLELILGGWQGYNLFWANPTYGWWLSVAATCFHISNGLHNVIAWMKIKPFMSTWSSRIFICTIILVQPYWMVEIYATFTFFNDLPNSYLFSKTRPIETVFRDPWWVASCIKLVWTLKRHYDITFGQVITISPRFAVILAAMALGIVFCLLDILSVTSVLSDALPTGVNPFWKLALVFKCLTDTLILDDFKTALDKLWSLRRESLGSSAPLTPRQDSSKTKRRPDGVGHPSPAHFPSRPGNSGFDSFELRRPSSVRGMV
ncbi:hypothetical protein SLS63_004394 [Diaporthe eres]|uniref:Uncharacterized protein n=1 Tax=Diaporthe eres TaxID=83184 RepID=A0ABR1PE58_DIAER